MVVVRKIINVKQNRLKVTSVLKMEIIFLFFKAEGRGNPNSKDNTRPFSKPQRIMFQEAPCHIPVSINVRVIEIPIPSLPVFLNWMARGVNT
jgi:hypothetical protein